MANKYTRKSQVKKPDQFVSFWTRTYDTVRPYARPIGIGLIGFAVVVAVVWVVDHIMVSGREEATEMLGRAVRIQEGELIADEKDTKTEGDIPRFKTAKERAEAALAEVEKLEKAHGSRDVTLRAQLLRAGVLFELGRIEDAEAAYKKYLDKADSDDKLRFLAQEGIGLCAETRGKLDEALTRYQALGQGTGDFYRDRALFAEARVLAKKGDKQKAIETYRKILEKSPTTPLKDDVQARLAVLGGA